MTRTYEAVLQMLAEGYWRASDIAQALHNMGLTSTPSPGAAAGVLSVLQSIGLVEAIPLWKTRRARVYYRHRSSATSILYRLEPIADLGLNPDPQMVRSWMGIELQFTLGELLARYHNLKRAYTLLPDGMDVDVVLLDRAKPLWGYEVKAGLLSRRDAISAVRRIRSLGIPNTGLVSAASKPPQVGDNQLGPEDIVVRISSQLQERVRSSLNPL